MLANGVAEFRRPLSNLKNDESMNMYEYLRDHLPILHRLNRAGVSAEDVANMELYEEYSRMEAEGVKRTAIVAELAAKHRKSERGVWRIVRKFRKPIEN